MCAGSLTATSSSSQSPPDDEFETDRRQQGSSGFSSRTEYEVDAAGRFLLNVRVGDAASSPITIMQNWDLLTKR
jgi:hypothetical protein